MGRGHTGRDVSRDDWVGKGGGRLGRGGKKAGLGGAAITLGRVGLAEERTLEAGRKKKDSSERTGKRIEDGDICRGEGSENRATGEEISHSTVKND